MVKIENNNKFKVGDHVWYFDYYGNLRDGEIYEITDAGMACTREGKRGGVTAGTELENCWPSKEACLEAEQKRCKLQVEEYKRSIRSVEDLVRFLWKNDINSECPDYEAKRAAKERAADFGINLED